jgi:hypothetical protein
VFHHGEVFAAMGVSFWWIRQISKTGIGFLSSKDTGVQVIPARPGGITGNSCRAISPIERMRNFFQYTTGSLDASEFESFKK